MVANDPDTGLPLAIFDCSYLTGLRTAAVSAIAARLLARVGTRDRANPGAGVSTSAGRDCRPQSMFLEPDQTECPAV